MRRIGIQPPGRDLVPAIGAITELPLVHTQKRCPDPLTKRHAPPGVRLRHRLTLHRVHPAQPPHRLLIQRYGRLILCPGGIFGLECFKKRL